ncbi:phytanoyl-CoA dioxygenase family protein [Microlunatus soli]|uniref:Phytanoyl-CoA dioxygenase (PhyH) n=1 Tax=Microlunatus soli TaxID=630515 RepID=A0A1H1TW20_9ACTN|nr:phytanoyl-CoA dioxygenase family protein [Microlunatus soli]SDS64291.1 Phytanoyl-CoA dioxygenase (PhyH) [Microlunatus soli]
MQVSALEHRLSEEERATFEDQGFLQIEDAIAADHLKLLTEATDRIHERHVAAGNPDNQAMFVPNFIPEDELYLDLVDYEPILPKIWGILGWNLSLYHSHLIVTPPSGATRSEKTFGWHQDSGRVNFDMPGPHPRLSVKVAYFLSDVSEAGRGNFWVIPGSHKNEDVTIPDGDGQPEGAVPVLAKPGMAVLFDRRLWHAASPNWSDITRKVLFYGYGHRWIKPKDEMTLSEYWDQSDPIRKQLLGYATSANGCYTPTEDDVPLRAWLAEHSPSDVDQERHAEK